MTYIHYYCSWFKSIRHVERIAQMHSAMSMSGWNCILVLSQKPTEEVWEELLKSLGITVIYHPRPKRHFDLKCIFRVYRLCKRYGCSIFHCDNMHTSPLIGSFLSGAKVRIWYKRAMNSDFEKCRKKSLKDRIAVTTRLSCTLATNIVAVSTAVKNELVGIGIKNHKVSVNNNPRPLPLQLISRDEARKKFNYSKQAVVVLSIGHAVSVKGWLILLEAFNVIAAKSPDLYLLLVGSTESKEEKDYFKKIEDYIEKNNLYGRVRFTGYLNNIKEVLSASDIFVLPSLSEGSCNALIEAMDAKLPCISTDVGNARELIKESENGFIVERNNINAIAEKIMLLSNNKEMLATFKNNCVVQDIIPSFEQYVKNTVSLFKSFYQSL